MVYHLLPLNISQVTNKIISCLKILQEAYEPSSFLKIRLLSLHLMVLFIKFHQKISVLALSNKYVETVWLLKHSQGEIIVVDKVGDYQFYCQSILPLPLYIIIGEIVNHSTLHKRWFILCPLCGLLQ